MWNGTDEQGRSERAKERGSKESESGRSGEREEEAVEEEKEKSGRYRRRRRRLGLPALLLALLRGVAVAPHADLRSHAAPNVVPLRSALPVALDRAHRGRQAVILPAVRSHGHMRPSLPHLPHICNINTGRWVERV